MENIGLIMRLEYGVVDVECSHGSEDITDEREVLLL